MVERRTLTPLILVRIQVPQPTLYVSANSMTYEPVRTSYRTPVCTSAAANLTTFNYLSNSVLSDISAPETKLV